MQNYHRDSVHSNGYADGGPGTGDDAPTYNMEHLATFTVAKETGIVYPADGMRRLLQLEKSNGIWSQKMQLRLDRHWLLIMDYETGAVMERFPVKLIQEPTAFTSHDVMELYNNILVFIVGQDQRGGDGQGQARSEMHIFQCQSISAQELVEDLKLLRVGKMPMNRRPRSIPPPPATPPPEPPGNGVSVREQVSAFNAANHRHHDDETSSTSSDKYERDVTILNHCFDDIEKFIARLQHAAAASRELERRHRNRKSHRKDLGDGMLSMRAKPPPESEFIDIFQKFKLSFNLLAKLKAHIHDPNAPELVHFLFTPLALIVDASHDTHYGPNLPAKVVNPLLTREAVNLLVNCVTSKETELWNSLGDAWLIPRDQWKSYVPEYHPVFLDGWSPDYPVSDERERVEREHAQVVVGPGILEAKRTPREPEYPREPDREDSHYSSDYFDYDQQETAPSEPHHRGYAFDNRNYAPPRADPRYRAESPGGSEGEFAEGANPAAARSDISADSIERNGAESQRFDRAQARWLDELRSRDAKVVQVTYPRTANNDKELTVIRGEYLEILDDSRKWWKARNSRGQEAHVPHTIVTHYQHGGVREGAGRSPPIPPPTPADRVRQERTGKKDYPSDSDFSSDEDGLPVQGKRTGPPPPAPPPPPPVQTTYTPRPRSNTAISRDAGNNELHEELKTVLTMYRPNRPILNIVKTPEVFIYQSSSAKEVQEWLRAKSFSEKVCKQLNGMTGNELFGLTKKQLVDHCGAQEGNRLDSQITIQRNISGYATVRSTELRAILIKAREKAEHKTEPIMITAAAPKPVHQPKQHSRPPLPTYNSDSDSDSRPSNDGGLADMIKKTTLKRTNIPLQDSK